MKKAIVLLILLASPLMAQTELTVEDAIKLGLKNNFDIRIARNDARIANNNAGRGTAGFLPIVDASAGYNLTDREEENDSALVNSEIDNLSAQVSFNWTLFDGFRMFAERSKYNSLARLGEFQARAIIENAVVGISRAYYNLVQQELLLDVAGESLDISRDRLDKARVRNDLGGASSTDLLNAQVAFNIDQATLINQELAAEIARDNLNVALGQDPSTSLAVSKQIRVPSVTMEFDEALVRASEFNSSILATRESREIAARDVSISRSSLLPRLSLTGSYGYNDRGIEIDQYAGNKIELQTTDASVGLQLSFNLFNGTRDKINIQNARIEANNRELALRDAENRLAGTVREACQTLQQRTQLSQLEEENLTAASQNLQLQQDRYQLGASSSLEFRDAQVSLARSQTALIQAQYEARIAWLEVQQLTGSLPVD